MRLSENLKKRLFKVVLAITAIMFTAPSYANYIPRPANQWLSPLSPWSPFSIYRSSRHHRCEYEDSVLRARWAKNDSLAKIQKEEERVEFQHHKNKLDRFLYPNPDAGTFDKDNLPTLAAEILGSTIVAFGLIIIVIRCDHI